LTLTPMRSSRFLTLTDNSRTMNRIVNRSFSSLSSFYSMLLSYALKAPCRYFYGIQ
jgi:multidrug efflux pump subunit AcrB